MVQFHYSVNRLSHEEWGVWTEGRTFKQIRDEKRRLMDRALAPVALNERQEWVISQHPGVWQRSLRDVYIAFRLSWLFTKTRGRSVSRALKMVGVPLVKVRYGEENQVEVADDGFDVVNIAALSGARLARL